MTDWTTTEGIVREIEKLRALHAAGPTVVNVERALALADALESERADAKRLYCALAEVVQVADLRGDSDLPSPCDDPKLWTARMIDAWQTARDALSASEDLANRRTER